MCGGEEERDGGTDVYNERDGIEGWIRKRAPVHQWSPIQAALRKAKRRVHCEGFRSDIRNMAVHASAAFQLFSQ